MPAKKRTRAAAVETTNNQTIDSFFKASDKNCDPPIAKKPNLSGDPETSVSPVSVKKSEAQGKLWASKLGAGSLGPSWMKVLVPEFKKDYFTKLMEFVKMEREKNTIYPPAVDVFSWTNTCPIDNVKVVILGQDPYHGDGQAHGLCFSVRVGIPPPPSLNNIYKEIKKDIQGFVKPAHGHLEGWAKQGVLLLNACLTVRAKQPNSHSKQGWEQFTDAVILWLNTNMNGLVFMLWGANAQKKGSSIDKKKHHVLTAPHPSPFSASKGFFGCKHFSSANELLVKQGQTPIDWSHLPETI